VTLAPCALAGADPDPGMICKHGVHGRLTKHVCPRSDQIKQLMALSAPMGALNSSSLQLLQTPLAAATSAPASGGSEDADSGREGQTNAPPLYPGLYAGLYHPILHGVSQLLQATGQTSLPNVSPPIGFSSNSIISVGDFLKKMQSGMTVGHNFERLNLPQSEQPLNPAVQISNAANPYTGAGMNYLQKAASASGDAGMGQALLVQQAQLAALSQQLSQVQALLKQPPTSGPLPLYGVGTEAQARHLPVQTAGAAALIAQSSQRAALPRDEAREPLEGAAAGVRKAPAARNATVRWTRAEHEQFLRGLEHFGTGMWSSISQVGRPPLVLSGHAASLAPY